MTTAIEQTEQQPAITPAIKTGFVYKCYHKDNPNLFYIGSTSQTLTKRLQQHRDQARKETCKSKWFKYMKEKNYDDFRIVLIEEMKHQHSSQLREREDYHIRQLKPQLNERNAKESPEDVKKQKQDYYEANKAVISEKTKAYREANKDIVKTRKQNYYEANKAVISEKKKAYREANKETIKLKKQLYQQQNKEKLSIRKKAYYSTYKHIVQTHYLKNAEKIKQQKREMYKATKTEELARLRARPICYTCSLCKYETNNPSHALRHQRSEKHQKITDKFELYCYIRQQFDQDGLNFNPFQA